MSTKMLGVVGQGLGCQKVGIELGSNDFYPKSIPTGVVPNFLPSGTPSGKGFYLTVYPSSHPNTDTV